MEFIFRLISDDYDDPHKVIANLLTRTHSSSHDPKRISLRIEPGVFSGYFSIGVCYYLAQLVHRGIIEIDTCFCSSSGCITGIFLFGILDGAITLDDIIKTSSQTVNYINTGSSTLDAIIKTIDDFTPGNIHELCSDRLVVTVTELTPNGHQKIQISSFQSKEHLLQVAKASSHIPLLLSFEPYTLVNERKCIDGGHPLVGQSESPILNISSYGTMSNPIDRLLPGSSKTIPIFCQGMREGYNLLSYGLETENVYWWSDQEIKDHPLLHVYTNLYRLM